MAPFWRQLAPCVLLASGVQPPPRAASSLATARAGTLRTVVVTLGQALNADRSPAETLVRRTDVAAVVYRNLTDAILVVTGGDPWLVGVTEAETMRKLLLGRAVPSASIRLEPRANNTVQNAIFSVDIVRSLGAKKVVLVTSDFHMPRAAYTFEAVIHARAQGLGLTLQRQPVSGGCAPSDAPPDAPINEWSLVQRLRGEEDIIRRQVPEEYLPSEMPDVLIPSPGHERLEQALTEVREQLRAASGATARASVSSFIGLAMLLQLLC
mmetsp:Transcript_49570/g.114889  ORF Transcript_49570/g.114889 Transcript_49570/m.114889 type:complete len:267 (-) Transcript_49570:104-904(-)|eukprot:CAMPEP_0171109758 /NCGR_PEP_ID=MMETSP0766_2-20121228/70962_1 /TAXON_ID=439317 /ORGANISM="Gambierdiscus australes, Strain CAWD 149" /LENGTH=266 /DNA_ID=CAMNT_0011571535 /DNA_START=71 /DNA_END=871 /DNA_ORIENTATION=-